MFMVMLTPFKYVAVMVSSAVKQQDTMPLAAHAPTGADVIGTGDRVGPVEGALVASTMEPEGAPVVPMMVSEGACVAACALDGLFEGLDVDGTVDGP